MEKQTIRGIMKELDFVFQKPDIEEYEWFCLPLILQTEELLTFSVDNDNDKRSIVDIVFSKTRNRSTFKNGHINTVYCILPREYQPVSIQKYRDTNDKHMFKYLLPEREFNSFLASYPIDMEATIKGCKYWFNEA